MSEFFDNGAGYLLRLMLLCAVVFGVGRGALDLLMKMAGPEAKRVLRNENFVAIAFGLVVVLLVTWGLTVLHLYGYASLLGSLLAFIVIAAAFAPRFRAFLRRPWAEIDATFVAYAAGSATFWLLVDISEYPLRKAAALYLLQGSGLSPGQNGTQWPNFGTMIGTPILYTGHLITSISALLSHDAPFAFYVDGLYALNVLTAPALLIGAFLLFRRSWDVVCNCGCDGFLLVYAGCQDLVASWRIDRLDPRFRVPDRCHRHHRSFEGRGNGTDSD